MSYPVRRDSRHPAGSRWWDPYAEIEALHRRLDQLFFSTLPARPMDEWSGDVHLDETADGWLVEAQLPGVPPEAIDVELDERDLVIRGEATTRTGNGDPAGGPARRRYAYRLRLPGEVDTDRAEAELEYGVLAVSLPRSAQTPIRKLPVVTGSHDQFEDPGDRSQPDVDDSWSGSIPTTAPPSPEDTAEMSAITDQTYLADTEPASATAGPGGAWYGDMGRPSQPVYPYEAVNRQYPSDIAGHGPGQPEPAYFPEGPAGYAEPSYQTANYPHYGAETRHYGPETVASGSYPVPGQVPSMPGTEPPMADQSQQPLPDLPPNEPPPGYPPNGQPAAYNWNQEPGEQERRERRDHPT